MKTGKKILILRLGAMGDILFTTPAIRALKRLYPDSHITYVTMKKWRFLLSRNPLVDRVFGLRYRQVRAARALARERFDLVVNLHEFEDGAQICESVPATERRGNRWLEGRLVPDEWSRLLGKDLATQEELRRGGLCYAALFCRIAQVEPDSLSLDFHPGYFAIHRGRRFLRRNNLFASPGGVALHLHSRGSEAKSWSPESALALVREMKEMRFLVLGYNGDRDQTSCFEGESNVVVSYDDMAAQAEMLQFCVAFVGIDSGPRQLAVAMGTPTVTLFGPTPPEFVPHLPGDVSLVAEASCAPCYAAGVCREGRQCIDEIATGRIAESIREVVAGRLARGEVARRVVGAEACLCEEVAKGVRAWLGRLARRLRNLVR